MLTARDVTVQRGGRIVLDTISITVGPGHRVGIVGPNGIGKSTFLRVLAGLEPADSGRVERAPRSLRVGYLPQEPDAHLDERLVDYFARRTGVAAASAELDRLTDRLVDEPGVVDAYSEALEQYLGLGGDDLEARAAATCADVGLPESRLDAPVGTLSGGQLTRTVTLRALS